MRFSAFALACALAGLSVVPAAPAAAQAPASATPPLVADLLNDIEEVRDKLMQLADAIPEGTWDWRPGEGVRSVREVFQHVAADNYLLAIPLGTPAPAATGIVLDDYGTVLAYEARTRDRAAATADMDASFAHLTSAMAGLAQADLDAPVTVFGSPGTGRSLLVLTTTHLHEHLGQLIAYARMNGVVPPWSAGQDD